MLSGRAVESMNGSISKVSDQDSMREFAEVPGSHCNSPGCVEPRSVLQGKQQLARGTEHAHIPETRAMILIQTARAAMGKRDNQVVADILNIERSVGGWNSRNAERRSIVRFHPDETRVVDFHPTRLEIGRIEARTKAGCRDRASLVDRLAAVVLDDEGIGEVGCRIPTGNGAVFGHEQKDGLASADLKSRSGIENGTGWSGCAGSIGSGDFHDKRRAGTRR